MSTLDRRWSTEMLSVVTFTTCEKAGRRIILKRFSNKEEKCKVEACLCNILWYI